MKIGDSIHFSIFVEAIQRHGPIGSGTITEIKDGWIKIKLEEPCLTLFAGEEIRIYPNEIVDKPI